LSRGNGRGIPFARFSRLIAARFTNSVADFVNAVDQELGAGVKEPAHFLDDGDQGKARADVTARGAF
jgi:hypothetical protein